MYVGVFLCLHNYKLEVRETRISMCTQRETLRGLALRTHPTAFSCLPNAWLPTEFSNHESCWRTDHQDENDSLVKGKPEASTIRVGLETGILHTFDWMTKMYILTNSRGQPPELQNANMILPASKACHSHLRVKTCSTCELPFKQSPEEAGLHSIIDQ